MRPHSGPRALTRALGLVLAGVLAWGAGRWVHAAPSASAGHVIVLSLDGTRADAARGAVPMSLAARGSVSWTAQTIAPSVTLPSQASMVSGVGPGVHGVTFNDWRPGQPYFRRATIFTEVTRANARAVAIVHKSKLLMLTPPGSVMAAQHLVYPRYRQSDVVEAGARVFVAQRPALLFLHVADPDDAGHRYGWMSGPYLRVVAGVPALIERLLRAFDEAGVAGQGLLIVTADHGGHRKSHGTNLPADMTIPWMAFGGAARSGVVIDRPIATYDTATTVLAALGLPIPGDWQGRPVREALR